MMERPLYRIVRVIVYENVTTYDVFLASEDEVVGHIFPEHILEPLAPARFPSRISAEWFCDEKYLDGWNTEQRFDS